MWRQRVQYPSFIGVPPFSVRQTIINSTSHPAFIRTESLVASTYILQVTNPRMVSAPPASSRRWQMQDSGVAAWS